MSAADVLQRRHSSQRELIDDLKHHINRCDTVLRDGSSEERQVAAGQRQTYIELLAAIENGYLIQPHAVNGLELSKLSW